MTATTFERFKTIVWAIGGTTLVQDMGTDWHLHLCCHNGLVVAIMVAKASETDEFVAQFGLLL